MADQIITEQQIHEIAEKSTPVKLIENSLAKFLQDTFMMAREEDEYQKKLKEEIIRRLPDMKPSELIALMTSASTNKNDMLSKLISPTMSLLTASQQNELSLRQAEKSPQYTQNNIKEINTNTPAEIMIGLESLRHFMSSLTSQN